MAASASSLSLLPSAISRNKTSGFRLKLTNNLVVSLSSECHSSQVTLSRQSNRVRVRALASVSVSDPQVNKSNAPDELINSILSKVRQSDRGVLLKKEQHQKVAEVAQELEKYCVDEPVKCPLVFGDWDVVYCSRTTSPGGGYRSEFGRLFIEAKEMIQGLEAPDIVKNKVTFTAFGFLDGEVSLTGKLKALNEAWVQVIFEPPELKVGGFEFRYGGESEVKLKITYVDNKIRLGRGHKGSLFVFKRRN